MTANEAKNAGSRKLAAGAGICRVCGQPSEQEICAACADKIRAEALADAAGEAPKARPKPGQSRGR
jgi:hypothetical protein